MNFFKDQQHARKQTRKLIFLYILTVMLTALATGVVFSSVVVIGSGEFHQQNILNLQFVQALLLHPALWYVSGIVMMSIFMVSFFKILTLRQGGEIIAKYAGAIPVDLYTHDLKFKQYINIVQEMSIASGTPCPQIFYMPKENTINAFAAGFEIHDAVVAVSAGAIEQLDRDELQGVVAHEFSHIFNGDMKLNIKLIGYLAGLSAIAEVGSHLMRSGRYSRSKDRNNSVGIGLALFVIGGVGGICAFLIKSAISRQREYLADASAVQFTRNPKGIAGALQKILKSTDQDIKAVRARDISHFFFFEPFKNFFSLLSTHPPLVDRIKRIDKNFNSYIVQKEKMRNIQSDSQNEVISKLSSHSVDPVIAKASFAKLSLSFESFFKSPSKASCLALAFFLDKDSNIIQSQLAGLNQYNSVFDPAQVFTAAEHLKQLSPQEKLHCLDMLNHHLVSMDVLKRQDLQQAMKYLVDHDKKLTMTEYLYFQFLKNILNPRRRFSDANLSKNALRGELEVALSLCIELDSANNKEEIYKRYSTIFFGDVRLRPKLTVGLIDKSLTRLRDAALEVKQELLLTADLIINSNNLQTEEELLFQSLLSQNLGVPSNIINTL